MIKINILLFQAKSYTIYNLINLNKLMILYNHLLNNHNSFLSYIYY